LKYSAFASVVLWFAIASSCGYVRRFFWLVCLRVTGALAGVMN
jgi:hypothetical protein